MAALLVVSSFHLFGDETTDVLRPQFFERQWSTRELVEQQPLDDAQPALTGAAGQAPGVAHVRVVAAQLIGNRTGRRRQSAMTPCRRSIASKGISAA